MSLQASLENQSIHKVSMGTPKISSFFSEKTLSLFVLAFTTIVVSTLALHSDMKIGESLQTALTILIYTSSIFVLVNFFKLFSMVLLGADFYLKHSGKYMFQFSLLFVSLLITSLGMLRFIYVPIFHYSLRTNIFSFLTPILIYSLIGAAILNRMKKMRSSNKNVGKSDATFSRFFDDEKTEKITLLSTALILGPGMVFLLHQNPYWPATLQSQLTIVVYLSTLFLFFNFFELLLASLVTFVMGHKPAPNFILEYSKFFFTFISTSFMMYALVYIPIFHYNPNLSVGMFITPPAIYSFLAAAIFHRFKQMKDIALKSKVAQAEAQYSLLESQMQPHFLFNSLNVLSELIYVDPDLANSMAQKMADLYREILNNSKNNFSNLESEISILKKYVEIQKIRFGDRIDFSDDVSPAYYNLQIPSLMLQTLVENAIKHGISPKQEGGTINLSVDKRGNMFEVCISNTGALYKGHEDSKRSTGLQNTKNRLELAYGSKNSFQIYSDDQKTYVKFLITGRTP